ncbi:MAG: winged helix-turn-helix domain-containing protein [Bacteroidia bacterium]|nr:winged helix-turn-helix domain-containing protein [Bacteroidia bacterium]
MKAHHTNKTTISLTPDYLFDFRKGSMIQKNGKEIFLEHRLKDFITILINNKNDVVTRDELMHYVWKDVIVTDDSITKAASDLRKFIAQHKINGLQLITIRKLGYKLEIDHSTDNPLGKTNVLQKSFKVLGYVALAFVALIILIRAINY